MSETPIRAAPRKSRLAVASLATGTLLIAFTAAWIVGYLLIWRREPSEPNYILAAALGVVLVFLFLAPVIFGVAGLVVIHRSSGQLTGRALAIAGIALSLFMMLVWFGEGRGPAPSNRLICAINLKAIHKALELYRSENENRSPSSLSQLFPRFVLALGVFECPSAEALPGFRGMKGKFEEQSCSYRYVHYPHEVARPIPADFPILFDKGENHQHEGMNALFGDGHIEWITRERFISLLSKLSDDEKLPPACRDVWKQTLKNVIGEAPPKNP